MKFDFDSVVDRTGTASLKWDMRQVYAGVPDALPFWVADMDFTSPSQVIKALEERVRHGVFGYTMWLDSYFRAVTGWMERRFGWHIEREWIVFTPGVVPALHFAVQAFTRPGEKVIIQPPVYHPFRRAIEISGRQVVNNRLKIENGRYVMDLAGLEKCIDQDTRLLILCSPHNPVGRVWREDEIRALAEICRQHGLVIVSDEIHADLVMPGFRHTPLAMLSPEIAGLTITCTAPNKTFNIAGLQMGNIIISDTSLRRRFARAAAFMGVNQSNILGIAATEAAYNHGEDWLAALIDYLAGNYRFLCEFCRKNLPKLLVYPLEGTYLAWLDFGGYGRAGDELKHLLLHKARVWLAEGEIFGPGGEGFQRINIACPRSLLEEGLSRIAAALK